MIQSTSREAYETVKPTLNKRQQLVLDYIKENHPCCNLDIAEGMLIPINAITPRVLELRGKGLIVEAFKDVSSSGRKAIFWQPPKDLVQGSLV